MSSVVDPVRCLLKYKQMHSLHIYVFVVSTSMDETKNVHPKHRSHIKVRSSAKYDEALEATRQDSMKRQPLQCIICNMRHWKYQLTSAKSLRWPPYIVDRCKHRVQNPESRPGLSPVCRADKGWMILKIYWIPVMAANSQKEACTHQASTRACILQQSSPCWNQRNENSTKVQVA